MIKVYTIQCSSLFFLCYSAPPQKDVTNEHVTPLKMGRVRNIRITALTFVNNNE